MTAEHFQHLLDVLMAKMPFRPFTIELVGGRRFEVDHARALAETDGVAVCIAPGGVPILFDHDSVTAVIADIAGTTA